MATHIRVRKQFILDPDKLQRAKQALGAKTDTETVERALELVIGDELIFETHRKLFATPGEISDVYRQLSEED